MSSSIVTVNRECLLITGYKRSFELGKELKCSKLDYKKTTECSVWF